MDSSKQRKPVMITPQSDDYQTVLKIAPQHVFKGQLRHVAPGRGHRDFVKREGFWLVKIFNRTPYLCFEKADHKPFTEHIYACAISKLALPAFKPQGGMFKLTCLGHVFTISFDTKQVDEMSRLYDVLAECHKQYPPARLSKVCASSTLFDSTKGVDKTETSSKPQLKFKEKKLKVDAPNRFEPTPEISDFDENRSGSVQLFEEFSQENAENHVVDKENMQHSQQPSTSRGLKPANNRNLGRQRTFGTSGPAGSKPDRPDFRPIAGNTFYKNKGSYSQPNRSNFLERAAMPPTEYTSKYTTPNKVRDRTGTRAILGDCTPVKRTGRTVNTYEQWSTFSRFTEPKIPKQDTRLIGFSNLGNTCYLNAILQALYAVPNFVDKLEEIMDDKALWRTRSDKSEIFGVLIKPLHDMYVQRTCQAFLAEKKRALDELRHAIASFAGDKFTGNIQQDAHELLVTILDRVKEEVDSLDNPIIVNPTTDTFQMLINHSITCIKCRNEIHRTQTMNEMFIFPKECESVRSIQELVEYEFAIEQVEYKCENCGDGKEIATGAFITRNIASFPKVLNVSISRYHFDPALLDEGKITREIAVPKYLYLNRFSKPPILKEGLEGYSSEGQIAGGLKDSSENMGDVLSDDGTNSPEMGAFSQEVMYLSPKKDMPKLSSKRKETEPVDASFVTERKRHKTEKSAESREDARTVQKQYKDLFEDELSKDKTGDEMDDELKRALALSVQEQEEPSKEELENIKKAIECSLLDQSVPSISSVDYQGVTVNEDASSSISTSVDRKTTSDTGDTTDKDVTESEACDVKLDRASSLLLSTPSRSTGSSVVAVDFTVVARDIEFNVVDEAWQREQCNKWDLPFHSVLASDPPRSRVSRHDPPGRSNPCDPDGNCFFHSISMCITGDPDHHKQIRKKVVEFELKSPDKYFRTDRRKGDDYSLDNMKKNGVWSTEMEIWAVATMTNTSIYTYTLSSGLSGNRKSWGAYHPRGVAEVDRSGRGIFLNHVAQCHYDVVLSTYSIDQGKGMLSVESIDDTNNVYQLIAVVSHIGDSGSRGHYICDMLTVEGWKSCDDSKVEIIDEETVLENRRDSGYIFFYQRKDTMGELCDTTARPVHK